MRSRPRGAELWVCENGFTSINPPLSPERRGSLSTRTTNPSFLDGLADTLRGMGLTVQLVTPFEHLTKGGVLKDAAKVLSTREAEPLFSMTHSCGKPSWFSGFKQSDHCGVCYGCLVRRGALGAAALTDRTKYIEAELRGDSRRAAFLTATRRKDHRGCPLPPRPRVQRARHPQHGTAAQLAVADALTIVRAGLAEFAPVVNDIP